MVKTNGIISRLNQTYIIDPIAPPCTGAVERSSGLLISNIIRGADDVQNRTPAWVLLQNTRVPTRVPAGADLAGVLRKRFWLQRRAVLAAGAERVPTGADCASRVAAYDLR